jgi:capsular polysaccharide biosynthesis protein
VVSEFVRLLIRRLYRLSGAFLRAMVRFSCNQNAQFAGGVLAVVRFIGSSYDLVDLYPVKWISEFGDSQKTILDPELNGYTYMPMISKRSEAKRIKIPAVTLSLHKDAEVCPESSSILVDGVCIIEDIKGVDLNRCDYNSGNIVLHGKKAALIQKSQSSAIEKGIFLSGNGSFNYYHWMIELLPKLKYIEKLHGFNDFPLLVSEQLLLVPSFQEALNVMESNHPVIYLKRNCTYRVGVLAYITAVNVCPFNLRKYQSLQATDFIFRPSSIAYLKDKFNFFFDADTGAVPRRIFLARDSSRRGYNQEEIFKIFEKKGFEKVYMENLSLEDQYNIIASSEMIAGPTGAAWTNLLFCKEGTQCVCWMAEESLEFSAYSNLAKLVGADMHYILYKTGAKSTDELYSCDYELDSDSVESLLQEIS